MLEIGCGSGAFLSLMEEQGWYVSGVEFSSAAAARIRAQGFAVTSGAIEVVEPPHRDFDLVVAWMVVEHLHDPVRALARVRAWCKPHAALVISVPDAGGVEFRIFRDAWYALSLPIHLYHFSEETIRLVLSKAGWEVDRIFWHNNPNNLLHSLRYLCGDHGWRATAAFLQQIADGQRMRRSRMVLGKLLGLLRVSGAMTVWAHATDGP
jgi:SAM-dependent methyltransferase